MFFCRCLSSCVDLNSFIPIRFLPNLSYVYIVTFQSFLSNFICNEQGLRVIGKERCSFQSVSAITEIFSQHPAKCDFLILASCFAQIDQAIENHLVRNETNLTTTPSSSPFQLILVIFCSVCAPSYTCSFRNINYWSRNCHILYLFKEEEISTSVKSVVVFVFPKTQP